MSGIKYLNVEPSPGDGLFEISSGFLRANVNTPIVAKLLLKIPQGEYINREIVSRVVLYKMANPELSSRLDFDHIFYTLGEPEDDVDFGVYRVPYKIFIPLLKRG